MHSDAGATILHRLRMRDMPASEVHQAAIDYLKRGWSVIPVRPRSKTPLLRWQEFQHRLATEAELAEWFATWPQANIAIVTGSISGLAVLDIDPRHGGEESLQRLEQSHGALPPTVEARTGGGGRHLYFALPPVTLPNRVALLPGIDVRADGGIVVAPPSTHPSGAIYHWRPACSPAAVPVTRLPSWLLNLALHREPGRGHPSAWWRDLLKAGVEEGARNNTIASLAGHLLWHGVDPDVATELMLCWNRVRCRPPLDDTEVVQVMSSIVRLHNANHLARN